MEAPRSPWQPLDGTSQALTEEILRHGPLSRAALARRMGLSQASLTRLTKPLVTSGLLVEKPRVDSPDRVGRREQPLDVVEEDHRFIGVKITQSTVYGVLTTMRATEQARHAVSLADREVATVVAAITEVVEALAPDPPDAVGIGLGGLTPDGRVVREAHFLRWRDVPLAGLVADRVKAPTVVENDLVALTELERWFGAGREYDSFAVLTIGAGIGYGLVSGGRLMTTDTAGVGLVGHSLVDIGGPRCHEGHRGCAQAVLSTPALRAAVAAHTGQWLPLEECLARAAQGDGAVVEALTDACLALGRLIGLTAGFSLAEAVVLAGEAAGLTGVSPHHVADGIEQVRPRPAPSVARTTRAHDFTEWARGAAVVAIQSYVTG